jgi:hypothetical protein
MVQVVESLLNSSVKPELQTQYRQKKNKDKTNERFPSALERRKEERNLFLSHIHILLLERNAFSLFKLHLMARKSI